MGVKLYQVDAFTDRPFAGNPAAVCMLEAAVSETWMQDVAREMNLSETAFLLPEADGYGLRWFTPAAEVELCGHATLASAHVLWETGALVGMEVARFHTASGLLTARRHDSWIELDFPATPPAACALEPAVLAAVGVEAVYVGCSKFDTLIEAGGPEQVRRMAPDMGVLRSLGGRGVIVTSRGDIPGVDFISRFFAPAAGIDEDPVTGSAHCCLGPYWAEKLGKNELAAYQASPRGGNVRVRVEGERVMLGGQAVTVLRGELAS